MKQILLSLDLYDPFRDAAYRLYDGIDPPHYKDIPVYPIVGADGMMIFCAGKYADAWQFDAARGVEQMLEEMREHYTKLRYAGRFD